MNQDNKSLVELFSKLDYKYEDFNETQPVSSMSNTNIMMTDKLGHRVILRTDSTNNNQVIVRSNEIYNSAIMMKLGISPESSYKSGYKLSKYIDFDNYFNKNNSNEVNALINSLSVLHSSRDGFKNVFNPYKLARKYLDQSPSGYRSKDKINIKLALEYLESRLNEIQKFSRFKVPCQIDMIADNLLYVEKEDKMYIIDQEYSGMYYRSWDLADVASESFMTSEEELDFLSRYNIATNSNVSYEEFLLTKSLCNIVWCAWTVYYTTFDRSGYDYDEYYEWRYRQHINSLLKYEEITNERFSQN